MAPILETHRGAGPAGRVVVDDDGVRHRLWVVAAGARGDGGPADRLIALAEAEPIVIADGHHRYETALEYREQRGARRACTEDPPYETIFSLLFDLAATEMTILPTHRVVAGEPAGDALMSRAGRAGSRSQASGSSATTCRPPSQAGPIEPMWRRVRASGSGQPASQPSSGHGRAPSTPCSTAQATPATRTLAVSVLEAALSAAYGLDRIGHRGW